MCHPLSIRLSGVALVLGMLALAVPQARADYSAEQYKADIKLFDDMKQLHTDPALLDFFKQRMVGAEVQQRIVKLIDMLSNDSFKVRKEASEALIQEGPPALPALRKVINGDAFLELKKRCDACVKEIEKRSPNTLVTAAARILMAHQAPGACAVLLDYVPLCPDDVVEDAVQNSIYHLALAGARVEVFPPLVKSGQLDPVLVKALGDKEPARRAIAALIVGQFGSDAQRQEVKKLLEDQSVHVRFRAAQGLLVAHDKTGLPVLVELLQAGPLPLALQAEDMLSLAAQEKGPAVPLAESPAIRAKAYEAWKAWVDKNAAGLDLTKADLAAPFGGIAVRATTAATEFLKAIFKYDIALLAKTTDVPFTISGFITFQTRDEFDKFLMQNKPGPQQEPKVRVSKVISAAEYLRNAPENERGFLEASRPAQVHVVYVEILEGPGGGGGGQQLALYIRISGGRARCIGIGILR